jgi:hypothetical protein
VALAAQRSRSEAADFLARRRVVPGGRSAWARVRFWVVNSSAFIFVAQGLRFVNYLSVKVAAIFLIHVFRFKK